MHVQTFKINKNMEQTKKWKDFKMHLDDWRNSVSPHSFNPLCVVNRFLLKNCKTDVISHNG